MNRREFLKAASIGTLSLSLAGCSTPARAKIQKPNIIFLMSDQQRWDAIGKLNPMVVTPALDKLSAEGITFDQATCQGPMCVPSRYSMMLGLYPSQVGVLRNGHQLPDAQMPCRTLPEILRDNGYQTAGFGKTHWGGGGRSTRGFDTRYIGQPSEVLYEQGATMMGDKNPGALARYNAEADKYGPGEEDPFGYVGQASSVPEEDHRDGWVFNQCMNFLDSGLEYCKPLFLYLSFLKPHAGHNVPAGYEELYNIDEFDVVPQPPFDLAEPCHATGINREKKYRDFWKKASPLQWKQMQLRYFANCSWIDSMFGRVLDKLQSLGLLENSLIIYVSDHGEMLGERYYRFNKYCLFDSSVRVPIILSGSVIAKKTHGKIDHRAAELVDVLPTIQTAAGIAPDPEKPGRDLLSLPEKQGTFCELHEKPNTPSFMWRSADYKLILTMNKPLTPEGYTRDNIIAAELYNLIKDRLEWHNELKGADPISNKISKKMTTALLNHINKYKPEKTIKRA